MDFLLENPQAIAKLSLEHLSVSLGAVFLAMLVGIPLGVVAAKVRRLEFVIITATGLLYLIPSLALFAFLIPFLGLGTRTAVAGLSIYSLLVITRNVAIGISGTPPPLLETGRGLGMTTRQLFLEVELPLALPMVVAGVRVATVMTIGITSLAAYIGAGGLGTLIFRGIATSDNDLILAGALPVAALALLCDGLLRLAERTARRA